MSAKWNVALNLKGVGLIDPLQRGLPTGIYKVRVKDSDLTTPDDASKAPSIKLTCIVLEGEQTGSEVFIWMGTDTSKEGTKRGWKTFLRSAGAPAEAVEGDLTIGPETVLDKTALLYVEAKPADAKEGTYDRRNFVTPEMAAKIQQNLAQVKQQAPAAGTNGAASGPTTPQPSASGGAAAAGALRF